MGLDDWIPNFKVPKIRQGQSFTKEELIKLLAEIRSKGWIRLASKRQGRDGGLGNTLEDLLGIRENNIPLADYGEHELKTHRAGSNSLITLFHLEPYPRSRQNATIPYLVQNYGWPIAKYGPREQSLRVDIDAAGFAERGFIGIINEDLQRVELHFDSTKVPKTTEYTQWLAQVNRRVGLGDLNPIPYWSFEDLEKALHKKIRNMVFLTVETKVEKGRQKMRILKALLLENVTLQKFLEAIKKGHVQIEFNARTHHNHGTAFRTWERYWPKVYSKVEWLIGSESRN